MRTHPTETVTIEIQPIDEVHTLAIGAGGSSGLKPVRLIENVSEGRRFVTLEPVSFHEDDDTLLDSDSMQERAKNLLANCGACHALSLLESHKKIPASWRGFTFVINGTIAVDSDDHELILCLFHRNRKWHLEWFLYDGFWDCFDHLLRIRE